MSPKICNVPEFWTMFEKKYFFFGFLKKCLEIRVFVHQTDRGVPCKEIAQLFHFGEYQQVMVDASNVKVNSRFLQKPPVMKSKSGLFFPPKIKPVILFPFTAKAKNLTFSSLQDQVLKGRQAFKTDVVQLIRVWRRWAVVCRGRHKSSKLLLTSWYVVFGDGHWPVASQWL